MASDVIHKSKNEFFSGGEHTEKVLVEKKLKKMLQKKNRRKIENRKIKGSFELRNLAFHFLVQ